MRGFIMTRWTLVVPLVIAVSFLSACTSHRYREVPLDRDPPTSISVDARQRLIIVAHKRDSTGRDTGQLVVCAEPSPDVFGTLAVGAALNAKLPSSQTELGGSTTFAETASSLAIRTQTVQLLRDGLYRTCEAYLNGVLDNDEYRTIIKAYDELMITMIAVEGLTQPQSSRHPETRAPAKAGTGEDGTDAEKNDEEEPANSNSQTEDQKGVSEKVHEIVRDYYCFQIGMKQKFYPSRPASEERAAIGDVGDEITDRLCAAD